MNDLLNLKGTFEQASRNSRPGPPNLPRDKAVEVFKLEKLKEDFLKLKEFWSKEDILKGALVSVYYNQVAAKSNRIKGLLSKGMITANSSIVGARFSSDSSPKHIITHYVQMDTVDESITRLTVCISILKEKFNGVISYDDIKRINEKKDKFNYKQIAKTNFLRVIVDAFYVEKFDVFVDMTELKDKSIITVFETESDITKLMSKIGIDLQHHRIFDSTTILLRKDELSLLRLKAPYLISMAVTDISKLTKTLFEPCETRTITIPSPKNEPTIGVIDTLFDENVYFSEWVEYRNMLDPQIPVSQKDYKHGTSVSSIIVDGPASNPHLDDGCGRFKVRHFGVSAASQFSSFSILRHIKEIISTNRDIKVWNLSLGSKAEINQSFISPEAAILDKIQYENDVIFIIAGTNKDSDDNTQVYIGSPADSINALVVNSVKLDNSPATYSRQGPVLSFFTKPDVSYYGGDKDKSIQVCTPTGAAHVVGTSYAAPWISRKMSYLIDILGLSREVAKALLINASAGWDKQISPTTLIGHGIVPVRIEDIVKCPDNEIQFVLSGVSEKYDTYNYNIPVPIDKEKHPFIAKATLCYFPCCSRSQGVDYTNTELDIKFGRIKDNDIQPINNNYQNTDSDVVHIWEQDARKQFRKWDNVKHVREVSDDNNRARKSYGKGNWGISLKTIERLDEKYGTGIKFGVVVSLREINGVNRIEEFIRSCILRGWLVNRINVETLIDIYTIAEEEIDFTV